MSDDIGKLLRTDALYEAEQITGELYGGGLGLLMHMSLVDQKRKALEAVGDTTFSNKLDRYVEIINGFGFECVLTIPFDGIWCVDEEPYKEIFCVYWHPAGLLLSFDTYSETNVNSAKVLYNWVPKESDGRHWRGTLTSSGHCTKEGVWVGDHDAREALIYHMEALKAEGKFLDTWVEQQFMWLLHYMDTKDEDYDHHAITAERVAMLPEHVRKAIGEKP